ncbi:MAG: hypothetical protein IJD52_03995 [Alphaproteobacteria bacterium]|nr:hypothetical protein [Alphaproteobacteria bacterium]
MSDIVYKKIGFSTPFLTGYKTLRIPIVSADGVPIWPQLFPLEKIEQMRLTVGPRHFSAQMMLEFVSPDKARLDPGGIHFYDSEFDVRTARIGTHQITGMVLYWDPSTGRKRRDNSTCVLLYRDDASRNVFVHDILYLSVPDEEEYPLSRQCEMVLEFMRNRDIRRISVETNGIGGGLPDILRNTACRHGQNIYIQRISNNKSKSERILNAIEPILSTGRMYAHARIQQTPLLSEMLGFSPLGMTGHDDGIDALAGAIVQTPSPIRPSGTTTRMFAANTNFKI